MDAADPAAAPSFPSSALGGAGAAGFDMGGRLPDALRFELTEGTWVERRTEEADWKPGAAAVEGPAAGAGGGGGSMVVVLLAKSTWEQRRRSERVTERRSSGEHDVDGISVDVGYIPRGVDG